MSKPHVDHIGIAVRSLDKALDFYCNTLGTERPEFTTIPHERVRVAMLSTGESRIELIEATDRDSPIAKFIEERGEGIHHIALRVPDLEAAVERIKAQGGRLVAENIQTGAEGYRYVFVHPKSTGGVLLELIQG